MYNPENIFKFYIAKDAFSCIIKGILQCYFALKKPVMNDCLTPVSQAEKNLVINFPKTFITKFMIYNENYNTNE